MTDHTISSSDVRASADALPAPLGRRQFIVGAAAVAGASAVATAVPAGSVSAALPSGASAFVSLPSAVRLADTRYPGRWASNGFSDFTQQGADSIQVKVSERAGVPKEATAAVLTLTAVNGAAPSDCRAYPAGTTKPTVSNLNLVPGAVNANLVTVKLGAGGAINIDNPGGAACHKIVDVVGYYKPVTGATSAGRFKALETPQRVLDTRKTATRLVGAKSYTHVDVTAVTPADAASIVINLTATECQGAGHFSALPDDYDERALPKTSSVNVSAPGDTRAAGVIVPVTKIGTRRFIKVFAFPSAAIVVDAFGYYTSETSAASTDGLFVPMNPLRILDTRKTSMGRMWPNWVVEAPLPTSIQATAGSVVANVTGVLSRDAGYLKVSAARRPIPNTSSVNWTSVGAIVPNHVMTRVTNTYGMQVFNLTGSYVLVDLYGYFTGAPQLPQVGYINPPPPAAPPNWTLVVPRLGLVSTVMAGDAHQVTDAGYSWHWSGTGYLGQEAHVSVFGHRTEHGGPYRNIHLLQVGDMIDLHTGDGRIYTYRMVRRDLVQGASSAGPSTQSILAATRLHPGTTFSMIACTRTDLLPTSLHHRLVVTFELVCGTNPYCFKEG